jgi:hypothetical protein
LGFRIEFWLILFGSCNPSYSLATATLVHYGFLYLILSMHNAHAHIGSAKEIKMSEGAITEIEEK